MSGEVIKWAVGIVVGAHGIGHVLGPLVGWGVLKVEGTSARSWLLSGLLGDAGTAAAATVAWAVPLVGFVAAAGGLLTGHEWWRQAALVSALASLAAIALFWEALPAGSRLGALVFDAVVVVGLAVANWPSAELVGS